MPFGNTTLSRLSPVGRGVLTNPYFEHLHATAWHVGAAPDITKASGPRLNAGGATLSGYNDFVGTRLRFLKEAPGWYPFGARAANGFDESTFDLVYPPTARGINPFRRAPVAGASADSGVSLRQGPWASGIIQRIRRGHRLLGKRVRVSGAYYTNAEDSVQPSGISVWLRGVVHESTTTGRFTDGGPSGGNPVSVTSGSDVVTLTSGSFPDITLGDPLWLSVAGQPSQIHKITQVISLTQVRVSTNFSFTSASLAWAIGRQFNGNAAPIGSSGIFLNRSVGRPLAGHVVRMTEPPFGYAQGPDYLNRITDHLIAGQGYDPLTPEGVVLSFQGNTPVQGRAPILGTHLPNFRQASTDALTGSRPYGTASRDSYRVFYIDSENWSGVATQGNIRLHQSTSTKAEGVRYFEEVVTIPSNFLLTTDDVWAVAMLVDPTQVGNVNSAAGGVIFALNIEVLGNDVSGGDGIESRLYKGYSDQVRGETFAADLDLDDLMQYPIYSLVTKPLDLGSLRPSGGAHWPTLNADPEGDDIIRITHVAGVVAPTYWAQLPPLPLGSVVEDISIYARHSVDASDVTLTLYEKYPRAWTGSGPSDLTLLVGSREVNFPADTSAERKLHLNSIGPGDVWGGMYRHRVGQYWDDAATDMTWLTHPAVWFSGTSHYLGIALEDPEATSRTMRIHAAAVRAWVDVRLDPLAWYGTS